MTNNEILRADFLDILFEKRNKEYGAYALRKTYDRRLWFALCGGLVFAGIIAAAGMFKSAETNAGVTYSKKDSVLIKEYVVVHKQVEQPAQPKKVVKQQSVPKTATARLTSKVAIKKDDQVKNTLTTVASLTNKQAGEQDVTGKPDDGTVKGPETITDGDNAGGSEKNDIPVTFMAQEKNAAFPGGPEGLSKYLADNLRTPEDLAEGEKKEVKIRFRVDADGGVSGFEIVSSGGPVFDKEVLRVCKKMPRWTPALQNGINVPVNYMIPVTFIGVEL